MNCLSCQNELPTKLGYLSNAERYCKHCFIHIVEKRVRKYIREHAKLKKDQRIVAADQLSNYFAQHVIHVPIMLLKKPVKNSDTRITLRTLNDIVVEFLEHFFLGKKKQKKQKNELSLFQTLTDEELLLYCAYKELKFSPKKHKLKEFIRKLEQEHPGTLHSMYKSAKELDNII